MRDFLTDLDPANPGKMIVNAGYGALDNLAIAFFVLAVILAIAKFGRGFLANISVLLGIVIRRRRWRN